MNDCRPPLRKALFAVVLTAVLLPQSVHAAEQHTLTVQHIDTAGFPALSVYVSLNDAQGLPIRGVDSHAFQAEEDGRPATGLTVDTTDPVVAALVVDVGSSMAANGKLDRAREAASVFVNTLRPGDRASIMSFGSRVTLVQDYTSDTAALRSAIDSLSPRGASVVYDALDQAARRQAAQSQSRRPIILLTDADDSASTATLESSIAPAVAAHAAVYVIGLGSNVNREALTHIARATSGDVFFVADGADLNATVLQIASRISGQYAVRYASRVNDGASHTIDIHVTYGGATSTVHAVFTAPPLAHPAAVEAQTPVATQQLPQSVSPTSVPTARVASAAASLEPGDSGLYLIIGMIASAVIAVLLLVALARRPRAPRQPSIDPAGRHTRRSEIDPYETVVRHVVRRSGDRAGDGATTTLVTSQPAYFDATLDGDMRGTISVNHADVTLGRQPSLAGSYPIKLDDDNSISRNHARIVVKNAQYFIEDLHSENGTECNGSRLAARVQTRLNTGDRIVLGKWSLTFHAERPVNAQTGSR